VIFPYRPRKLWLPFHMSEARHRVAVAHRRAGKTIVVIAELIRRACQCPKPDGRYAYVAPYLNQAKAIAWDYIKRLCSADPDVVFHETELRADFPNGARIRVFGADNADALRGLYFDGVVLDEVGDMDPRVWTDVVRPALSDRRGWVAFAGTPRGKNHFYDLSVRARAMATADWAHWQLKASETRFLSEAELEDARLSMGEDAYEREYECSFAASVEGAFFAREMAEAERSGRITPDVPVRWDLPVNTAWDLGIDDATVIWFFQDIGRTRRIIDYLEVSGAGVPEIARMLDEKGYLYGDHFMPHDADSNQLGTGESIRRTFERCGFRNVRIVPRADSLLSAINAARLLIPYCWFDSVTCARGIECLKQYRREWDTKRQTWRERPLHDWTSHAADAFRTLACGARSPIPERYVPLEVPNFGVV